MNGPFSITAEQLASIQDPSELFKFHVKFVPDRTSTTVASQEESLTAYAGLMESEPTTHFEFFLAQVGDRILIVRSFPNTKITGELVGTLYKVPLEVYRIARQGLGKDKQQTLLPYMLDTTDTLGENIRMLFWFTIPLALVAFVNIIRAIYRLVNSHEHPLYRRLQRHGNPKEIEEDINSDFLAGNTVEKDFYITSRWIIRKNMFSLKIARNYFDHGVYDLYSVFH